MRALRACERQRLPRDHGASVESRHRGFALRRSGDADPVPHCGGDRPVAEGSLGDAGPLVAQGARQRSRRAHGGSRPTADSRTCPQGRRAVHRLLGRARAQSAVGRPQHFDPSSDGDGQGPFRLPYRSGPPPRRVRRLRRAPRRDAAGHDQQRRRPRALDHLDAAETWRRQTRHRAPPRRPADRPDASADRQRAGLRRRAIRDRGRNPAGSAGGGGAVRRGHRLLRRPGPGAG